MHIFAKDGCCFRFSFEFLLCTILHLFDAFFRIFQKMMHASPLNRECFQELVNCVKIYTEPSYSVDLVDLSLYLRIKVLFGNK